MEQFTVQLNNATCTVCIGAGVLGRAGALLRQHVPQVRRWALAADENASALYGEWVQSSLRAAGLQVRLFPLPQGESAKTPEAWLSLCRRILDSGFDRSCGVVTLGGGACGGGGGGRAPGRGGGGGPRPPPPPPRGGGGGGPRAPPPPPRTPPPAPPARPGGGGGGGGGGGAGGAAAGFAAASLLRGVPLAHIPTTLLAQVDSALGGKTALDLPEGKNLLGAFHQPSLVLSDPACLATLPQRQFASGMAEVIKTGLVADKTLLAAAEQGLRSDSGEALTALVAACGRAKLHLVSGDAEDHGARRLLNFGHTFGHGYEAVGGYDTWTHGEAVAAGMCRTLRWQIANGYGGTDVLARLEPLLTRYGLPTAIDCDEAALRRCVGHDKKTAGGTVQLVIVRCMGQGELVTVPLSDLWEDKA